MIKYRKDCKACNISKRDPKFRQRVYNATFYREQYDESYRDIARDYEGQITDVSISNHARKHIKPAGVSNKNIVTTEKRIAKVQAQVQKEVELSFDHKEVVPKQDFEQVWDSVITDGLDRFKKSNVSVTVNQLLAATKLKADYNQKKRGQDTEILKMMMSSASRGKRGGDQLSGAKRVVAGDGGDGAGQSSDIHRELAGPDIARRAEEILTRAAQA